MPQDYAFPGLPAGRRLPHGAEIVPDGVSFRVWAPAHQRVEVDLDGGGTRRLEPEADGWFAATLDVPTGTRYRFRLGGEASGLPDPASRFQPQGVSGPSEVVDPAAYDWADAGWPGLAPVGQVLYEMHVGTFTQEGSWDAAIARLPHLRDLGITAVELMPLAAFEGRFGWGYDGILLYAPTQLYGQPDDVRRFVDSAHAQGLGVLLDVVYNHFGPGDQFERFSPDYFRPGTANEWGKAPNYDAVTARAARDYYIANAVHWVGEYHIDGFRIDAAHAMEDESEEHVLAELVRAARAAAGERSLYIAAESERQDARLARPPAAGGYGLDAIWNEDFHHSAIVAGTGRNEGYMHDHRGAAAELAASARYGTLYQGQRYDWQDRPRGTPAFDLSPMNFVNYLQNHDQVANTGGQRFWQRNSAARSRALTALFLLSPQTPLLFQGQEFAARTPFHYFLGVDEPFAREVAEGRRSFLRQFQNLRDAAALDRIPDPALTTTRDISRLDWSDAERHAGVLALHRDLIALRRTEPALAGQPALRDGRFDASTPFEDLLVLRWFGEAASDDRMLLVNLGKDRAVRSLPDPLAAPPHGMRWQVAWSSEDTAYGGDGRRPLDPLERFTLPADLALYFAPVAAAPAAPLEKADEERWQHDIF